MNRISSSQEQKLISLIDWAVTLVVLVSGVSLLQRYFADALTALYQYFVQGISF